MRPGLERFLEETLEKDTGNWSASVVVRVYSDDTRDLQRFGAEAAILGDHGYAPQTQSGDGGHVHVGRLLLTGGLSVFAGQSGVRSQGKMTVTFVKAASQPGAPSVTDPLEQLRRLGQLRDAGVLSAEEFEAKKAEILGRV